MEPARENAFVVTRHVWPFLAGQFLLSLVACTFVACLNSSHLNQSSLLKSKIFVLLRQAWWGPAEVSLPEKYKMEDEGLPQTANWRLHEAPWGPSIFCKLGDESPNSMEPAEFREMLEGPFKKGSRFLLVNTAMIYDIICTFVAT